MPRSKKASVIKPIIKANGQDHVLELAEKKGPLPIFKAIGLSRLSPESRDFVSYVVTVQGDKCLSIEVSEPNLKAIIVDDAKTSFVQTFLSEDGLL